MFISTVAMSFRMMAEAIMQASGDTVTPMRITVSFRIFHALLSPLLIFGIWIFPRMGVTGAATANAVSYVGAIPVFVDIQPDTYNLDPSLLKKTLTKRTRAICPVHQVGLAADLQLASAFPETDLVEYLTGSPYVDHIVAGGWQLDEEGKLAIPEAPGLGIELDLDTVKRYGGGEDLLP